MLGVVSLLISECTVKVPMHPIHFLRGKSLGWFRSDTVSEGATMNAFAKRQVKSMMIIGRPKDGF